MHEQKLFKKYLLDEQFGVPLCIKQLSFKCRTKEVINYILFLFLFLQRIECDYFSNIKSRFNNIIHMLKRKWNFSTRAKIA